MAKHIQTGREGELLGQAYFETHGYTILEKNWRYAHWEVDIIASKDTVLHFAEIKTRRSSNYGLPEESVGKKKMQHLVHAAEQYLYLHPQWKRIQFDILSIIVKENRPPEYFLIEDVSP